VADLETFLTKQQRDEIRSGKGRGGEGFLGLMAPSPSTSYGKLPSGIRGGALKTERFFCNFSSQDGVSDSEHFK